MTSACSTPRTSEATDADCGSMPRRCGYRPRPTRSELATEPARPCPTCPRWLPWSPSTPLIRRRTTPTGPRRHGGPRVVGQLAPCSLMHRCAGCGCGTATARAVRAASAVVGRAGRRARRVRRGAYHTVGSASIRARRLHPVSIRLTVGVRARPEAPPPAGSARRSSPLGTAGRADVQPCRHRRRRFAGARSAAACGARQRHRQSLCRLGRWLRATANSVTRVNRSHADLVTSHRFIQVRGATHMPEYLAPPASTSKRSASGRSRSRACRPAPPASPALTRYGPVSTQRRGPRDHRAAADHELHRVRAGLRRARAADPRRRPARELPRPRARAFFLNGGKRLYVSRVFAPDRRDATTTACAPLALHRRWRRPATWRARWPGAMGNVLVAVRAVRRGQRARTSTPTGGRPGAARVSRRGRRDRPRCRTRPPAGRRGRRAWRELAVGPTRSTTTGRQTFAATPQAPWSAATPASIVSEVDAPGPGHRRRRARSTSTTSSATHPAQRRWIAARSCSPTTPRTRTRSSGSTGTAERCRRPEPDCPAARLLAALAGQPRPRLEGGNDGAMASPTTCSPADEADPDDVDREGDRPRGARRDRRHRDRRRCPTAAPTPTTTASARRPPSALIAHAERAALPDRRRRRARRAAR